MTVQSVLFIVTRGYLPPSLGAKVYGQHQASEIFLGA